MSRDNFSLPGYDAWKTRAPEDEPGYWDGEVENEAEYQSRKARNLPPEPEHSEDCQCSECVLPF